MQAPQVDAYTAYSSDSMRGGFLGLHLHRPSGQALGRNIKHLWLPGYQTGEHRVSHAEGLRS
jgi:hypothetical protein